MIKKKKVKSDAKVSGTLRVLGAQKILKKISVAANGNHLINNFGKIGHIYIRVLKQLLLN